MTGRVVVTGGPWPERIGCAGRIVLDEMDPNIYPRHGLGKAETIILLDDDPLRLAGSEGHADEWTCVMRVKDLGLSS